MEDAERANGRAEETTGDAGCTMLRLLGETPSASPAAALNDGGENSGAVNSSDESAEL